MTPMKTGKEGFTLLEVMVAIAILSLLLAGVMRVFSSSLTGIGKSQLHSEGTLVARQKIEETLLEMNLVEGVETGVTNEIFEWKVEVIPIEIQFADPEAPDPAIVGPGTWIQEESPMMIYDVIVTVEWPDATYSGRVQLQTIACRVELEQEEEESQ